MKKLIFVHVPKTAGSSFAYYLSRLYNHARDTEKYWRGEYTDRNIFESYDLIYGHFHYSKYKYLNRPLITLLRNPVERVISQYYYSNKPEGVPNDISLADYASLEICRNMISKQLGSLENFDFIGFKEKFNETLNKFEKFSGIKFIKRNNIRKRDNRKNKKTVSKKIKTHIKDMNNEDVKMYKMALTLGENDENNKRLDQY